MERDEEGRKKEGEKGGETVIKNANSGIAPFSACVI